MEQSVVITGASTGIGKACALYLDRQGFRVFAGVRRAEDGAALQKESSPRLTPVLIDVTAQESIQQAAKIMHGMVGEGGIAGLINNAGIVVMGALEFLSLDELRTQMEVNVIGQVAVTQTFLPLLRTGQGRILNISSTGGKLSTPFLSPYHASKFALEALSDALRMELATWAIPVIVIQPASIATPIWEKSLKVAYERLEKLSPEAASLYETPLQQMIKAAHNLGESGLPATKVAEVVHKALTVRTPKTRYLIGMKKWQFMMAQWVPDRVRDRIIMGRVGLNTKVKANGR